MKPSDSEIVVNAKQKIDKFNEIGLHYNLVANQICEKRRGTDPLDESFLPYIIAGLISFDMGRGGMMGNKPYEMKGDHFASRLNRKLQSVRPLLKPLMNTTLTQIDLQQQRASIIEAYNALSARGSGALHMDSKSKKSFHVGTTKILHFLNPRLFIIIDSNAARAFKMAHSLPFKNSTQPGYSAELYIKCMECARNDILEYGLEDFKALDKPGVHITRIYDKLTFVTGYDLSQK